MNIDYKRGYEQGLKKLKKYERELDRLDKIKLHIRESLDFKELKHNPLSNTYRFEQLKHEYSDYYSFNLCKAGSGVIRLILTVNEETNTVIFEFITFNHYKDFKRKK